ncbi:hypothetical protein H0H92_004894 [Tricholoma furcatifolium]|nr:hypothetical protein H0H92_004894 [Tricholoma furcatifolium]
MPKALTKVIYKPDHTSNNEYTVVVNPEEYKKWKAGGRQGFLGQPSKQLLDTDFGTNNDMDVVTAILEKGKDQASDSVGATSSVSTNLSRGNRGSVEVRSGVRAP